MRQHLVITRMTQIRPTHLAQLAIRIAKGDFHLVFRKVADAVANRNDFERFR